MSLLKSQIPNAPITFADDPLQESRDGDSIIAYTWATYLEDTSDPVQNIFLPMTRAAVRSMDTMQDFMSELLGSPTEYFTISGASKRGWTTWLTGAMDQERVAAIVPIVWDAINLSEVFHHQWRSYGGWSFALKDFVENGVMEYLDTQEMMDLQNLIDPHFYRTRLTMPKFVMTGLMDEFQMPVDEQYWWDDMPSGPDDSSALPNGNSKWLLKNPNTEHSYITGLGVSIPVMGTWLTYLLNGWELPYLTWDYNETNGDITVQTFGGDVYSAQIWFASSCHDLRRDFRIMSLDDPCECGPVAGNFCTALKELWHQTPLEPNEDGSYTGHLEAPTDGRWSAFVVNIQMTTEHSFRDDPMHNFFTRVDDRKIDPDTRYPSTPPGVLEFTSRGSVVPNTFPHDDCTQDECAGDLV